MLTREPKKYHPEPFQKNDLELLYYVPSHRTGEVSKFYERKTFRLKTHSTFLRNL